MLISGLIFVGFVFCSFVSIALSGFLESVVTVSCWVVNASGILICVHGKLQVNYLSMCGKLTLKNGDGQEWES